MVEHIFVYVRNGSTGETLRSRAAPLASLLNSSGCWESISIDFMFGLPKDAQGKTGIVVFVDRLSKMVHLGAVPDTIDGDVTATMFINSVF